MGDFRKLFDLHFPKISGAQFAGILLLFFLPFIDVSCSVMPAVSVDVSGQQLATGGSAAVHNPVTGAMEAQRIDREPSATYAWIAAAAGVALSFLSGQIFRTLCIALGTAGAGLLLYLQNVINDKIAGKGEELGGIIVCHYEFAFWLSLILFASAAATNFIRYRDGTPAADLEQRTRSDFAKTERPSAVAAAASHSSVPPHSGVGQNSEFGFQNFRAAPLSSSITDESRRPVLVALVAVIGVCILVAGAYWYFEIRTEGVGQTSESQTMANNVAAPQAVQASSPAPVSAPTVVPAPPSEPAQQTAGPAPNSQPLAGAPPSQSENSACGYILHPAIYQKWQTEQRTTPIGCPVMADANATVSAKGTTGRWVRLVGGDGNFLIMATNGPNTGIVYHVQGCIYMLYDKLGGTGSVLGFPTSDEHDAPGGTQEEFEGGSVYWSATTHQCSIQDGRMQQPSPSQESAESYYYLVGLDPAGDNWLALRSEPSSTIGKRLMKMGPDTLLTVLEKRGDWVRVSTQSGETGWASAKYIACCRTPPSR